jgi:hypothetical protein
MHHILQSKSHFALPHSASHLEEISENGEAGNAELQLGMGFSVIR